MGAGWRSSSHAHPGGALKRRAAFFLFGLGLGGTVTLQAETSILPVSVTDTSGVPVQGLLLEAAGGGAAERTNAGGKVRLRVAAQAGQWVKLQLRPGVSESETEWVFISPWYGQVQVPLATNRAVNFIPVVVGQRGNRALLENSEALKAMASAILDDYLSRQQEQNSQAVDDVPKQALEEQSRAFGLPPKQVDQAIQDWGEETEDPEAKGLVALYSHILAPGFRWVRDATEY